MLFIDNKDSVFCMHSSRLTLVSTAGQEACGSVKRSHD